MKQLYTSWAGLKILELLQNWFSQECSETVAKGGPTQRVLKHLPKMVRTKYFGTISCKVVRQTSSGKVAKGGSAPRVLEVAKCYST